MATKSPKTLPAIDAQEAARLAVQNTVNQTLITQLRAIEDAKTKARDAATAATQESDNAQGAREAAYAACAKAAHDGNWEPDQIEAGITAAIAAVYGNQDKKSTTLNVLASELRQCMDPAVRFQVPSIIATNAAAWEAETKALKDAKADGKKTPPTPLRAKHKRRQFMVMAHIRAARGETADDGTVKVAPVIHATPEAVIADAVTNAIPRIDTAAAKLGSVTKSVAALAKEYGKPDLFAPVLAALRAISAAAMVGDGTAIPTTASKQESAITLVPPAAPAPAPAAQEPVSAAAELDDVLALATQAAIAAVKAAMAAK
jgi:hypothetical protein